MKKFTFILSVFSLLFGGNLPSVSGQTSSGETVNQVNESKKTVSGKVVSEVLHAILDRASLNWKNSLDKPEAVKKFYLADAVFFPEKGIQLRGSQSIADYYKKNKKTFSKIASIQPIERIAEAPTLVYEIGTITADKQQKYAYITVWNGKSGTWLRELEAITEITAETTDAAQIDQARQRWMELCNSHKHQDLVENAYTKDAFYYNNGRLLQGWEQITTEYSYMSDPKYRLQLNPKHVLLVRPDLAYEIGKCTGSYGGHYIIRWEKQLQGDWRVSLDTNL